MATFGFVERIPMSSGDENSPGHKYLVDYYAKVGTFCDQALEEANGIQKEIPEIKAIQTRLTILPVCSGSRTCLPTVRSRSRTKSS